MTTPRYPYVHVQVPIDEVEAVSDQLWIAHAQGIEERDASTLTKSDGGDTALLIASFGDEEAATSAAALVGRGATVEFVIGDQWRDAWREYFKPTQISPRILVRPSWEEAQPAAGVVVLTIDPGNAFGSGLHETTRLVLREVDARVQEGMRVLDVGCGSGILSIAALLLGAKSALGTDIDPVALETTMENAAINDVESRMSVVGPDLGSITESFPLVLANIQAHVLIPMANELIGKVESGGFLVLSGILDEQVEAVIPAFSRCAVEGVREDGEWRAIVLRAP